MDWFRENTQRGGFYPANFLTELLVDSTFTVAAKKRQTDGEKIAVFNNLFCNLRFIIHTQKLNSSRNIASARCVLCFTCFYITLRVQKAVDLTKTTSYALALSKICLPQPGMDFYDWNSSITYSSLKLQI